jgi:hypothetical protein
VGLFGEDLVGRAVTVEPGLDRFLAGTAPERLERLVRRVLDPDLHPLLPAIRAALKQAGQQAVDEVVWLELLCEQHRDVAFSPWGQVGRPCYPAGPGEVGIPFDEDRFRQLEGRMAEEALAVCGRVGLLRRTEGVFAATADGLAWAGVPAGPGASVWVTSDLEVMVPPGGLSPVERLQLESFARCTGRDVVERYRLEKQTLAAWLRTGTLDGVLSLLSAHAPAVPRTVTDALTAWAYSLERVVLVHGVLLVELPSDTTGVEAE